MNLFSGRIFGLLAGVWAVMLIMAVVEHSPTLEKMLPMVGIGLLVYVLVWTIYLFVNVPQKGTNNGQANENASVGGDQRGGNPHIQFIRRKDQDSGGQRGRSEGDVE